MKRYLRWHVTDALVSWRLRSYVMVASSTITLKGAHARAWLMLHSAASNETGDDICTTVYWNSSVQERTVDPTDGVVEIIVTRTTTLNTTSASLVVNSLVMKMRLRLHPAHCRYKGVITCIIPIVWS
jgi:hypothetical protein